jgi:ABC-type polar amino acid transport system ATPase subunit
MGASLMEEHPPFLAIKNVEKRYGLLEVLRGVSFDVEPGEVMVLVGPSGCGKSTLLRCINGLEQIDAGSIVVDGCKIDTATAGELHTIRLSTGIVFQNFNLFPHMTVLQNLTIAPIKLLKLSRVEANERARELLDRVGISEKADVYPCALSGGQRQRVAIARALAMKPRLILFDEPTSALDPEMRDEVLNVIRSLRDREHMTMIVVTHEVGFGREVADRAILMESGKIVEQGKASTFFRKPTTERARRFLRSIINA